MTTNQIPEATQANLKDLLCSLGMKIPLDEIPENVHDPVSQFLKQEQAHRREWKITRLMKNSGIRSAQIRTFEKFDWAFSPKLPKEDILTFKNSSWIQDAANLLLSC
jgi:hypothetical protein